MKRNKLYGVLAASVAVTYVMSGCGGGGQDRSGRASIAIEWPEPGRLIPKAANFVRVRAVTQGGDPIGTQPPSVPRPVPPASNTTEITVSGLPVGANITFRAEAFGQNPDIVGGQQAQASGQQTLLIRNDAPNVFDISMASTVANVTYERDGTPIAGTLNLIAGEDANVTAQARTASGALVLVDPSNWSWTSGNADLKVNFDSTATGQTVVARAFATVTAALNVMETESNIPSSLNVQAVEPTYPGAVDGNIAGDATGFGDVAGGPMDTKAAGDRVFVLVTRNPCGASPCPQRNVDIHDANSATLAGVGQFVPSIQSPPASDIVRNSTGIALAYDNQTGPAEVVNYRDNGNIVWRSAGLDFLPIEDITARRGHTYALQDGPGVGFRVTKLRDSDGQIAKQLLAPPGFTPLNITVDDQESIYFALGDASPGVVKMDRNGDRQPFTMAGVTFNNILDIDFDQGLIFVLDDDGSSTGPLGSVHIFGQSGVLVQTITITRQRGPNEILRRMSVFRGQIFTVTEERTSGFVIREIER